MQKRSKLKLKKLAGRVLATTCLTAATGAVATASPNYVCGCGTTFGTATDVGLDSPVTGAGAGGADLFFEFEGLTPSAPLSSILTISDTGARIMGVTLFTDTEATIMAQEIVAGGGTATLSGDVPLDGNVVVAITLPSVEPGTSFSATLGPTQSTPEPGTLSAVGMGLLGVGALGRRRFRINKR